MSTSILRQNCGYYAVQKFALLAMGDVDDPVTVWQNEVLLVEVRPWYVSPVTVHDRILIIFLQTSLADSIHLTNNNQFVVQWVAHEGNRGVELVVNEPDAI